jgi:hypothetical protein
MKIKSKSQVKRLAMQGVAPRHFNELTPGENERLSLLMEECGETIQIIGKIMRHGYERHNPFDPDKTTNRVLLNREIGHIYYALQLLLANRDIDLVAIQESECEKKHSIDPYLHHQD